MRLFILPQLLSTSRLGAGRQLVDLSVAEIGLKLRGGRELTSRTPFPNKHWLMVGRRGNPPTDGLLIDVGDAPDVITVTTRWAVEARAVIVHELRIAVADRRRDVIAAHSTAWSRYGAPDYRWDDVQLPWMAGNHGSSYLNPLMVDSPRNAFETARGSKDRTDGDLVVHRSETMEAPTIEQERWEWIASATARYGRASRVPTTPINA